MWVKINNSTAEFAAMMDRYCRLTGNKANSQAALAVLNAYEPLLAERDRLKRQVAHLHDCIDELEMDIEARDEQTHRVRDSLSFLVSFAAERDGSPDEEEQG